MHSAEFQSESIKECDHMGTLYVDEKDDIKTILKSGT